MGYIFDALTRGHQDAASASSGEQTSSTPPSLKLTEPAMPQASPVSLDGLTPPAPGTGSEDSAATVVDRKKSRRSVHMPDNADVDERLVSLTRPSCVVAEEYRSMRTGLLAKWDNRRHLIHTVTSATPQEGKTITSLNLGLSFAELHNRKTLVIEADLRLPQFKKLLNLSQSYGLIGVLRGETTLQEATIEVGPNKLHVLPAGQRVNNEAVQLLSSPQMSSMLKKLKQEYDHIIIDTPPVVELADAGILGAASDDVLLIARMNRTPKSLIKQALRTLASYNAPAAGIIATDQSNQRRRYYYYRYGYRYQYQYASRAAA